MTAHEHVAHAHAPRFLRGAGFLACAALGTLGDIVNQTVDYQGSTISDALSKADAQSLSPEALTSRMTETYGVDVNEEVARLMELQNAYAANARVVSVVQELLDTLMQTVGR